MDSSKKTILVVHRDRLKPFFTETVNFLKDRFNIIVLAGTKNGLEAYKDISGITLIEHIDYARPEKAYDLNISIPETIKQIENELGINCYEFNKNYFLYRRYAAQYRVIKEHSYLNDHIPELLVLNYLKIKELINKFKVEYTIFETTDLLDSVILTAMASKGIITQTFERGFFSIGGEVRFRIASGGHKRSPRLSYVYKNKLFSEESLTWARKAIEAAHEKRVISNYDLAHMKMASFFSMYSPKDILQKLKRVITQNEPILPALTKQKNRIFAKKYFSHKLPTGKILTYFLQMTPEASMCYEAPRYADQFYLLEQIAIYGKYGYTIAVKEHPRGYGNRPVSFYKLLSLLPNVVLLPPGFSNRELITRSEAIISVTGTTPSVEAMLSGKPVITLGKPYFNVCENVYSVKNPQEIWSILNKVDYNEKKQTEYLAALYECSYPHPEVNNIDELVQATGIGPAMGTAIEEEISLYENGILKYSDIL